MYLTPWNLIIYPTLSKKQFHISHIFKKVWLLPVQYHLSLMRSFKQTPNTSRHHARHGPLSFLFMGSFSVCILHQYTAVTPMRGTNISWSFVNIKYFLMQATRQFNTEAVNQAGRHLSRAMQPAHTWDYLSWTVLQLHWMLDTQPLSTCYLWWMRWDRTNCIVE